MHPAAKNLLANPPRLRSIAEAIVSRANYHHGKAEDKADRDYLPESSATVVRSREWQELAAVLPELVEFYIANQPKVQP